MGTGAWNYRRAGARRVEGILSRKKIYRLSGKIPVSFLREAMVLFAWNPQADSKRSRADAENWREIAKMVN